MASRLTNPERDQDLTFNLLHLYVLHHACRRPVFGVQIIEELRTLGYKLSPGTMYPLLDALEKKGRLRSKVEKGGGTVRRIYRATASGRKSFARAKKQVQKLMSLISESGSKPGGRRR